MRKATTRFAGFGLLFVLLVAGCGGGSDGPTLSFTQIDPTVGVLAGGTEITLRGSGFSRLLGDVTFGRNDATSVRFLNDSTATCVTPPGLTGPCDVMLETAEGSVVIEDGFTYLPPVPTLTGVTPNEGPPGVGTRITLTGTQFQFEPVTVTLDGKPCGNVVVENDWRLTCTVPSIRSGQDLAVAVTTGGGTASLPDAFSYLVYPYQGTYFFVEFNGLTVDNEPGMQPSRIPAARSSWGTLVTDGTGIHTGGEVWTNDGGVVTGPTTAGAWPHHVAEDRRFTWGSMSSPDLVGRLSADASLGVLGAVRVHVAPKIMIVGRIEGTYDESSLSGLYHVGAVFGEGATRGALWGTTDFDESGGAASDFDYNVEGFVFDPPSSSDTYTVSPTGRVTYALVDNDLNFEGQILQDGELVILAGGASTPEFPVVVVLVKASSTADASAFSGNYAFAAMLRGNPAWDTNTGTASSMGNGSATVLDLLGHDGDVTWSDWPESPFALPYSVAPSGMLEADVDGSEVHGGAMHVQGAVMLGGEFAFFAGSRAIDERPMLWFLLR